MVVLGLLLCAAATTGNGLDAATDNGLDAATDNGLEAATYELIELDRQLTEVSNLMRTASGDLATLADLATSMLKLTARKEELEDLVAPHDLTEDEEDLLLLKQENQKLIARKEQLEDLLYNDQLAKTLGKLKKGNFPVRTEHQQLRNRIGWNP